jgi:starvation-inducible DNA-binding protein
MEIDLEVDMRPNFAPAGLSSDDASAMTDLLQERLHALVDLSLTLKHVHWNVVGPGFIGVHEMLDEHVEAVRTMADDVAERITTLGGIPNGLAGGLTRERSWDDYGLGRGVVAAHLGALDKVYDGVIGAHRDAIDRAGDVDPVTEDMLIAAAGKLELFQWFVRAHIENTSGELPTAGEETEIGAAAAAATADHLG